MKRRSFFGSIAAVLIPAAMAGKFANAAPIRARRHIATGNVGSIEDVIAIAKAHEHPGSRYSVDWTFDANTGRYLCFIMKEV